MKPLFFFPVIKKHFSFTLHTKSLQVGWLAGKAEGELFGRYVAMAGCCLKHGSYMWAFTRDAPPSKVSFVLKTHQVLKLLGSDPEGLAAELQPSRLYGEIFKSYSISVSGALLVLFFSCEVVAFWRWWRLDLCLRSLDLMALWCREANWDSHKLIYSR